MIIVRQAEEVQRWHFVFHVKHHTWWGERFIPGRFSHVSAFAYMHLAKVWILVEQSPRTNTRVLVWPEYRADEMPPFLINWTMDSSILAADVRRRSDFRPKTGFSCVGSVKDLIGSRSRALSPEGLFHDLVREGAKIVYDLDRQQQQPAAARAQGAG